MKITLVTEHEIIIGTLQSSTSQSIAGDGRAVQSAVNTTDSQAAKHEVGVETQRVTRAYCKANMTKGQPCSCGEHTEFDPLQDSDEPLGTPPATKPLPYHDDYCTCDECMAAIATAQSNAPAAHASCTPAVPPETLPPCAEGKALSLVLMVTNVVERNA